MFSENLLSLLMFIYGKAISFYDKNSYQTLSRPLLKFFEQAQQEVPEWLIDIADKAPGSATNNQYGGNFENFTSSDIRTRGGNDTLDALEPTQNFVDDDDEEWD